MRAAKSLPVTVRGGFRTLKVNNYVFCGQFWNICMYCACVLIILRIQRRFTPKSFSWWRMEKNGESLKEKKEVKKLVKDH